jgi:hypothetical protein
MPAPTCRKNIAAEANSRKYVERIEVKIKAH